MKYEIDRVGKESGKKPTLRLIAESDAEREMLMEMERELDSQFGRKQYVLKMLALNDLREEGTSLEYLIIKTPQGEAQEPQRSPE